MKLHFTIDSGHYAVSTNGDGQVLLQTGDRETGEQVRIRMTVDQALACLGHLRDATKEAVAERLAQVSQ